MSAQFIHLRLHTEYSLVDSVVRVGNLMDAVAQAGMPAVALTDQGNLFAMVKFYKAAQARGIVPIIGADLWVHESGETEPANRLTLLCQDEQGYHNLAALISKSYLEGQQRGMALVERAWIAAHSAGLIALSGAREGDVGRALLADRIEEARENAAFWRALFPDRYYLELQRTGREDEESYLHAAVKLAAASGLPVVATNDVRFIRREDFEAHEARVCIHDGRTLDDPRRQRRYSEQQYLRTPAEMAELFGDIPEALENSVEIARRCNLELRLGENFLPAFPVPEGHDIVSFLRAEASRGLEQRLVRLLDKSQPDYDARRRQYEERLARELDVVAGMGFPGYFLIVADFIRWARENGVPDRKSVV